MCNDPGKPFADLIFDSDFEKEKVSFRLKGNQVFRWRNYNKYL